MSAAKHTPGPWYVDPEWPHERVFKDIGDKRYLITLIARDWGGEEELANANLIAAAPQLLAELHASEAIILNALAIMTTEQKIAWAAKNADAGLIEDGTTRYHERQAVIAKAEGRS